LAMTAGTGGYGTRKVFLSYMAPLGAEFERMLASTAMREPAFQCRCKDGTQPPFYDASGVPRGVVRDCSDILMMILANVEELPESNNPLRLLKARS